VSGFAELRAALAASNLRAWQHDGFPGIRETMLDDGFTNSAAHLAALATRDAPALLAALDAAEADAARWRDRERANQLRAAQSAYSLTHCEGCDDPATCDECGGEAHWFAYADNAHVAFACDEHRRWLDSKTSTSVEPISLWEMS